MKWKLSRYILWGNTKKEITIYSLISGGMLLLIDTYAKEFNAYMENPHKNTLSENLMEQLIKGRILVPDELDELAFLKVMNTCSRFSCNTLGLTIAPTTKCNFACSYCYEIGNIDYIDMSCKVENQVLQFIKNKMQNYKKLSIAWYGGEPLLNIISIKKISQALVNENIDFNASIVTNGYNLTREIAVMLHKYHVREVQITLDGPPEIHDKRRNTYSRSGTFNTILKNITECCDLIPITIRINIDKSNVKSLDLLTKIFNENKLQGKINLYLAPVDTKIGTIYNADNCLSDKEFAKAMIQFYSDPSNTAYINTNVLYSLKGTCCGSISCSSFVIDPLGDLYKCWDDIGMPSEKVGTIFEPEIILQKHLDWLNYDVFDDVNCKNCLFLPVCMGGCPNKPLKNRERGCISLKYVSTEYLHLYKQLRQVRFEIDNKCIESSE